jgi:predicted dehydrogenase
MAPIRVAIIGLSQSAKTSWASQAHLPYLLSERGRQRYKITALLNSSKEAAEKAITTYNLSSDVKAYGSPDDLAADSNVDLVVCATRVDVHFGTVEPNVKAGKNVFVEWPLAENVDRATQLANWAKESGSKTLIGLQARVAPSVRKVKDLIESGVIGRVVSSAVQAYTPVGGGDSISEGLGYFLDKKIGGNPVTIVSKLLGVIPTETSETCAYYAQRMLGHMIDFVHAVLGEYESSSAQVQIQRPNQKIIDRDTGATKSTTSDVPDLVSIHGTLRASDYVSHGASLTVNFRTGPPFPGTKPFVWVIVGEKCRIEV